LRSALLLRRFSCAGFLAAILLLAGCALNAPQTAQLIDTTPDGLPRRHLIAQVPFHAQDAFQCGPAALAMALNHSGVAVAPDDLVSRVYVPARQGSFQVEMLAASRAYQRLSMPIRPTLEALLRWIAADQPVLVLQNLGLSWYPRWHYAVVIGYDLDAGKITLHSGETAFYTLPLRTFEHTWARSQQWGMVALIPGDLPVVESEESYFQALAAFEGAGGRGVGKAWRAGLQHWPESRNLLMGYGNHLYGSKQYAAAAQQYRRVVALNPEYAPAFNNLAAALVERGDRAGAIAAATRAIALDPGNAARYRENLVAAQALP